MNLKSYLSLILTATVLSFIALFLVLLNFSPDKADALGFSLFFLSLFLGLAGIFTLLGFYLRVWLTKNEIYFKALRDALRQGVIFSLGILGIIGLKILNFLTLWDALLLFGALILFDLYLKGIRNF